MTEDFKKEEEEDGENSEDEEGAGISETVSQRAALAVGVHVARQQQKFFNQREQIIKENRLLVAARRSLSFSRRYQFQYDKSEEEKKKEDYEAQPLRKFKKFATKFDLLVQHRDRSLDF